MNVKRWKLAALSVCAFLQAAPCAHGYVLQASKWSATAASNGIVMQLQLGAIDGGGPLTDGSASWGEAAENALAEWNAQLRNLHFTVVRDSTIVKKGADGKNSVFFDSTHFGKSFGDALAITSTWSSSGVRTEADVVFNTAYSWDSYRGPLRFDYVQDFYRVALHEFGHVLGLNHPDQAGQIVDAVMNANVSDLDHLQADDIAGGQFLWGAPLTPGSDVNFTATQPTGWSNKLVVSTAPGSHTDSAKLLSTQTLYVDYAVLNKGASVTDGTWTNSLYVDDVLQTSDTRTTTLGASSFYTVEDVGIGPLSVGTHTIKIVMDDGADVTETNETDNSYERTITVVPPSSVATLSKLVLSSGALSPAFSSGTTAYTAAIGNNVFSITVRPTVTQANATVQVNNVSVASGSASAAIPLAIGNNTITVVVTAEDGTTQNTYTLTAVRAPDLTKPTVVIKTPAASATINEGVIVTLSGTAADNNTVQKVQYSLNGGGYADATTTVSADGLTATYTIQLVPAPGMNTLLVKSVDVANNESAVAARSFSYIVVRPLVVSVSGGGKLPAPFPGTDSTKKVGFAYTLTATPSAGQVFDGWTANSTAGTGITTDTAQLAKLTFTHQEGLTLTAHFIPNPFTPAVVGKFNGLVLPNGGTLTKNETTGFLTATVTGTGSFTGTLKIDGLSLPVTGVFDNSGVARFGKSRATTTELKRTGKPGLILALTLDMTGTTGKMLGTVTAGGDVSNIDADRAFYSSSNKVSSQLAGTTGKTYTLAFRHRTGTNRGIASSDYPQGDGYATGTVKPDGTVTFAGKLADNTTITLGAPLSKLNACPLFAQLYTAKQGCIAGMATLNDGLTDSDIKGDAMIWIRPPSSTQWYPDGWPSGVFADALGSKYAGPPASVFPGLPAVDADNGNATLTFSGGLLPGDLTKNINISPTNVASKAPKTDTSFTFTLAAASGFMSGTVNTAPGANPTFQGVLFQKGAAPTAYGYFMSGAPKITDGTGKSGSVTLHSK